MTAINKVNVKTTAQDVTDAWADLGTNIDVNMQDYISLFLQVDINSSEDFRIRAVANDTLSGTDNYLFPIKTISASDVQVASAYYELSSDADQNIVLDWELNKNVPFIKFQISAGTVGATAGTATAFAVKGSNV